MKKSFALLLALVMILTLVACGAPAKEPDATKAPEAGNNVAPVTPDEPKAIENFNSEGYPIVNEPITLSLFGMLSGSATTWDNPQVAYLTELTGIEFETHGIFREAWEEQRGLILSSGDLPDIFVNVDYNDAEYLKYGQDGIFLPLNDLIDQYMPNLKACLDEFPQARALITSADGNIYCLPRIAPSIFDMHNRYWLNEKWVTETLGMEMPVTLEDYYNILVASKNTDLNGNGKLDEIPLSGYDGSAADGLFLNAFGINAASHDFQFSAWDDGTVYCINTSENYREYLRFMKKLYDEQLLDNEFLTQDVEAWRAKTKEARVMSCAASAMYIEVNTEIGYDWIQIDGLTTDYCPKGMATSWQTFSTVGAISTSCKHPEAAARLLDYFFTEEGGKNALGGVQGISWDWMKDYEGRWEKIAPEGYDAPETYRHVATIQSWPCYIPWSWTELLGSPTGNVTYLANMSTNNSKWFVDEFPFDYLKMSADDSELYTDLQADLDNYCKQARAEFITGVLDLDKDWDKYVSTVNGMGVAELTPIMQRYYDNYVALYG